MIPINSKPQHLNSWQCFMRAFATKKISQHLKYFPKNHRVSPNLQTTLFSIVGPERTVKIEQILKYELETYWRGCQLYQELALPNQNQPEDIWKEIA